jgi:transcriptional regulator with XRE-family HTH domain
MILQAYRKSAKLTQKRTAEKSFITERHYISIENGKTKPGAEIAINVAVALGITDFSEFRKLFGAATPSSTSAPGGNQAQAK